MMAFSQVEFAAPSSPFGCVHTPRSSCYENNVTSLNNGNSLHQIDYTDLWVHQPHSRPNTTDNNNINEKQEKSTNNSTTSPKKIKTQSCVHKDNWAKAREIVFDTRHRVDDTQSESSAEINNLGGVSSLVRKWRGFEAVAKCTNTNIAPPSPSPTLTPTKDSFGDLEPDRHAISGPPSFRSSSCREYSDSDRVHVSDIIRKLTEEQRNGDICENAATPKFRTSLDQQLEQKCFAPVVVNSPRIRGRHAFNDLLMQMERERHKDLEGLVARQAVSKFSHRGRIQALLRFKFLRQGMEANGDRHSHGAASSNRSHKSPHFARVNSREPPASSCVANSAVPIKSCDKELIDCIPAIENVKEAFKEQQDLQISSQIAIDEHVGKNVNQLNRSEHPDQKETNCLVNLEKRHKSFHNVETEPVQKEEPLESIKNHVMRSTVKEITCQQVERTKHELTSNFDDSKSCNERKDDNKHHLEESCPYWVSAVCHTEEAEIGWEEVNSDYQEGEESYNIDWIYEVSRPRSDWEDLRQARYQEMLDPFHKNEEIRTLLGRKSVSSFLSSDLRNQIDRVMLSRTQGQPILINNPAREEQTHLLEEVRVEDEEVVALEEDKRDEERENYGDFFDDEYEEAGSSMGQQYNEADDYRTSHSPTTTWSRNQFGHEISNYSSRVASPSPQRSFYSQDSRPSSAHPAIEMELIYDLRRHMVQLQQEMSELRKTIRCCVDMQSELQRSMKREFTNRSDEKKREARCSVCCKMQINCVLYRCGHMCTCFKCAHELQSSSGKCPICRAPIIDVVRTYYNS